MPRAFQYIILLCPILDSLYYTQAVLKILIKKVNKKYFVVAVTLIRCLSNTIGTEHKQTYSSGYIYSKRDVDRPSNPCVVSEQREVN